MRMTIRMRMRMRIRTTTTTMMMMMLMLMPIPIPMPLLLMLMMLMLLLMLLRMHRTLRLGGHFVPNAQRPKQLMLMMHASLLVCERVVSPGRSCGELKHPALSPIQCNGRRSNFRIPSRLLG